MARALVRLFIREVCIMDPNLNTRMQELHTAYTEYITQKNIADVLNKLPYKQLSGLFILELGHLRHTKCHGGALFHGIGIKGPPQKLCNGNSGCTGSEVLFDPAKISEHRVEVHPNARCSLRTATGSGGYIFFVRTKDTKLSPFLCKIGKTRDLKQRLPSLQTGSQDILEYVDYIYIERNVAVVEHEIHTDLKPLRAHGEWFSITEAQIKEICRWIAIRKLSLEVSIVEACHAEGNTRQIVDQAVMNTIA